VSSTLVIVLVHFCYTYNDAISYSIYNFILSSIIRNYVNNFLLFIYLLLSETIDYEVSENSKEASKEKGCSRNMTPKYLNGMTIL